MSTSTLILKPPNSGNSKSFLPKPKNNEPKCFKFGTLCLWGLLAIIAATDTEINHNLTGISVTITTQDCIMMLLSTWFLIKGLSESNQYYVIPWLLVSTWSLYNYQYLSMTKMYQILLRSRLRCYLPWIALGIDWAVLGLRIALILRVVHLGLNQWYNNKLRNELKEEL